MKSCKARCSFHQTISQGILNKLCIINGHCAVQHGKISMTCSYDLVVIGAGHAGESAAELAAFLGHSVVIVEKNKPGGVVTTSGGAPTKTLRESMLALTGFYNREVYGITVSAPPEVAVEKITERTIRVSKLLQDVTAQNIARNGVEYMGRQNSVLIVKFSLLLLEANIMSMLDNAMNYASTVHNA
ncbi:MAG: FAD-dependent oxidoreductase [Candidatus Nitrosopolaris sp.]